MAAVDELIDRARQRRQVADPARRREIRERAGLTQAEIAAAVDVDDATISRWESGDRSPRGETGDRYVALLRRLEREVLS